MTNLIIGLGGVLILIILYLLFRVSNLVGLARTRDAKIEARVDSSNKVNAALFLIYGVHVPYLPVWLDWRGLTPGQIGVVMAAPFFVRLFVTPSLALLADHQGSHRRTIALLALLVTGAALALTAVEGFLAILLLCVAFVVATHTIMPLTETIAVRGVRTAGLDYGRMRLWGSATFIAAGFAGGAAHLPS